MESAAFVVRFRPWRDWKGSSIRHPSIELLGYSLSSVGLKKNRGPIDRFDST